MAIFSAFFWGFFLGVVGIVGIEVLSVFVVIKRLIHKSKKLEEGVKASSKLDVQKSLLDSRESLDSAISKQGTVWVLEPEKVPQIKEQTKKNDFLVVSPTKKLAKITGQFLILKESDGSRTSIRLKGCNIVAVSATSLASRKWARKFPILLERGNSVVYKGNTTLYIYLETNWEKESWCKALRLASADEKQRIDWFFNMQKEFCDYLTSLKEGYPAFKNSAGGYYVETTERELENKIDPSSKVRLFLRKFTRKASRAASEEKANWTSLSGREEKKTNENFYPSTGSVKSNHIAKAVKIAGENVDASSSSSSSQSGSQNHSPVVPDTSHDDKGITDEGTLCLNLLASRLFFDAKGNEAIKRFIHARIQRSLSNMRIPSYIGEVVCTDLDLGNLPPYIHNPRVLPTDMHELLAVEVDIEYSGGLVLDIETRIEIRELDLQKGIAGSNPESSSVEDVSTDLLEGIETYGKQLNLSEMIIEGKKEQKDEEYSKHASSTVANTASPSDDESKVSKSTLSASTYVSKWKSIVNSIAKQVSEVPLSLSMRVAALRGTMQIHIKPPPSDQVWYSFSSMPDIEFNLESSVGDHKITSGHIALYLASRFKAAIRETLVLPNCESLCMPWMLAEKDDWVPRKIAPFIWLNQEAASDSTTTSEASDAQLKDSKTKMEASKGTSANDSGSKNHKSNAKIVQKSEKESTKPSSYSSSSNNSTQSSSSFRELETPLLGNDEAVETSQRQIIEEPLSYRSLSDEQIPVEDEDSKRKRMGRKARILDLGKKMGEKFEEKRRHIEEKGRHIVEKMRGP